ncbi:MAG: LacI family transcriptional regulator [Lachnospiraceae bacterium]|nr:LacI family transcriptional regulator [Lachnospiraceae bacterium]
MVSMRDVAKLCGVSVATVSKALNDYSDIGEETKRKIRETAEEAGYMTNASLRAMKSNRSWSLGVLYHDEARSGLTHDFFAAVLEGFKRHAELRGYDITFINNRIGERKMSYYEYCKFRGVDGVLIACVDFYDPDVQSLIKSNVPVVTIDHVFDNRIAVVSDNVNGMASLVDYVCEMGHTKLAYIHGESTSVTRSRLGSFYRSAARHGIEIPEEYVRSSEFRDTGSAKRITAELLSLPEPPTCIFYPDDYAAVGGLRAIWERNLRIPDDISIVGYDGILLNRVMVPKVTTLRQDTAEIGKLAADRLVNLIEKPRTTLVEHIVVPGTIVEGDSVKKLN